MQFIFIDWGLGVGAKKIKKKVLGRGVEALLTGIEKKVDERKQIPFAPPGFAEDQETLALSRHELLVERNKLKDKTGKAEAAIRALHRKIDDLKAETGDLWQKWQSEVALREAKAKPIIKPLVTPDGRPAPLPPSGLAPIPKPSEDEVTKIVPPQVVHTKERIEIPVVRTVEVPQRFDWVFELVMVMLVMGGVMIGLAIGHINILKETRDGIQRIETTQIQKRSTEEGYPEARPRDYVAPSVLTSEAIPDRHAQDGSQTN